MQQIPQFSVRHVKRVLSQFFSSGLLIVRSTFPAREQKAYDEIGSYDMADQIDCLVPLKKTLLLHA